MAYLSTTTHTNAAHHAKQTTRRWTAEVRETVGHVSRLPICLRGDVICYARGVKLILGWGHINSVSLTTFAPPKLNRRPADINSESRPLFSPIALVTHRWWYGNRCGLEWKPALCRLVRRRPGEGGDGCSESSGVPGPLLRLSTGLLDGCGLSCASG